MPQAAALIVADVHVAALDDIPLGTNRAFDIEGRSVLIARTSHGVFAVENQCSHALQPLEGGKMKAVHIFCPLHGVRFDLRDGSPSGNTTRMSIRTWPVTIDDGQILIAMGS